MSTAFLSQQGIFFMRILLAAICGGVIGYERKSRNKEAGIRTHLIVAAGAALIMIVSKYGFADILDYKGIALDPSRIAAQIVSGVGFLGAGMIFMRRNTISGLTTAAGIWATSGIGMAIGSGLYIMGVGTAILIIAVQIFLHGNHKWLHESYKDELSFIIHKDKEAVVDLNKRLAAIHIEVLNAKIKENKDTYEIEFIVTFPENFNTAQLLKVFHNTDYIEEIDV